MFNYLKELISSNEKSKLEMPQVDNIYDLARYDDQWTQYVLKLERQAPKVKPPRQDTRILAIADTHGMTYSNQWLIGNLEKIKDQKFDLVVFLGDIPISDLRILAPMVLNQTSMMCGVFGNHDSYSFQKHFEQLLIHKIGGRVIKAPSGVTIGGIDGCIKYKAADQDTPLLSHSESAQVVQFMPAANILISHDIFYDTDPQVTNCTHKGLVGISKYLYENAVPIHIHGHTHQTSCDTLPNKTVSIGVYGGAIIEIFKGSRAPAVRNLRFI